MRLKLMLAAAAALAALAIGDADACGRRGRGGGGGCGASYGGCGGAAYGGAYIGAGCDGCGAAGFAGNGFIAGYGNSAWAWRQAGPQLLLEHVPSGSLYASGADGVFRPTLGAGAAGTAAMPAGGASRAIAADRAKRASAVFTFDPLTGQARQVGWMNADGTLRPLAAPEGIGAPPK